MVPDHAPTRARLDVKGWYAPVLAVVLLVGMDGCETKQHSDSSKEVVLFTSLDQIFSEPVVKAFEQKTGIRVKLQTDGEAAKTVGLVTRLISHKQYPEADVFWNNEWAQTLVLRQQGILAPYTPESARDLPPWAKDPDGWWTGFAARARVILYNKDLVSEENAPKSIWDLTKPCFKNKVAIARPLFGTTFTHAAVLFSNWGEDKAKSFFKALKDNGVKLASGNAHARNLVADGEVAVCLTDTDDANGALLKGRPVVMVYPDQGENEDGALVIPNTVALIKGGPHPENAKRLLEFLAGPEAEGMLARCESAQMPIRTSIEQPGGLFRLEKIRRMEVNWPEVAKQFEAVKKFIQTELIW